MRRLVLGLTLILGACNQDAVEGTYHADDGEGSRATMILEGGSVQFWQGDTDQPPVTGLYTLENGQVILSLAGRTMTLSVKDDCLHPIEDPSQTICKGK